MERQNAEAHFLQDWKRRIDDGSHDAEVGDELESAADYERAYRQQEDHVVHMSTVRRNGGIQEDESSNAKARVHWLRSDHPLAKPLREFEDRRDSGHLKRRAEIAPMMLRAAEMCQTVPHAVPLRVANVV